MNLVYPLKYNKTFIYPLKEVNIILTDEYDLEQTVGLEVEKDCELDLNEEVDIFFECFLGVSTNFTKE